MVLETPARTIKILKVMKLIIAGTRSREEGGRTVMLDEIGP